MNEVTGNDLVVKYINVINKHTHMKEKQECMHLFIHPSIHPSIYSIHGHMHTYIQSLMIRNDDLIVNIIM